MQVVLLKVAAHGLYLQKKIKMKKFMYMLATVSTLCTGSAAQDTVNAVESYSQNVDTNTNQLIINGIMTIVTIVLSIIQRKKDKKNGLSKK